MNRQGEDYKPDDDDAARSERPGHQDAGHDPRQETVIDVSGDQPEFIEREPMSGTFFGRQPGEVRVWVTQSGPRGCLIPIGVVLLLVCCSCAGVWVLFDSLF